MGEFIGYFAVGYCYASLILGFFAGACTNLAKAKGEGWSLFIVMAFALGWPYWLWTHGK